LAFDLGHFSHSYATCARRIGLVVDEVEAEWGAGVPLDALEEHLAEDQ
jgi:alanine-glyoxylate transaminase/serine-glyoxylate transaminase/serine-pyruvate transaminase